MRDSGRVGERSDLVPDERNLPGARARMDALLYCNPMQFGLEIQIRL